MRAPKSHPAPTDAAIETLIRLLQSPATLARAEVPVREALRKAGRAHDEIRRRSWEAARHRVLD